MLSVAGRFFGALVATYWCLRHKVFFNWHRTDYLANFRRIFSSYQSLFHQGITTFNVYSYFLFSTICLLGILGLLAPLCEETIYRGFLMISLTKWYVVASSSFHLQQATSSKEHTHACTYQYHRSDSLILWIMDVQKFPRSKDPMGLLSSWLAGIDAPLLIYCPL